MRVRHYKSSDADPLARLFYDSIHKIASHHYSAEQLHAWMPSLPDDGRLDAWSRDGRLFLVAVDEDDAPRAFGDLEQDGHIDHLFCRPDVAGKGVTAVLYRALEEAALSFGLPRLYVEASEPAQRFFLRQGLSLVCRRDFVINGVGIHNFSMEKHLGDDVQGEPNAPDRS